MPLHEWEPFPLLTPLFDWLAPEPPRRLERAAGSSQCSYELLRAFAKYAASRGLRYSLASGTLLGAMRNEPPGLLQWEHDVDVYMPARDASALLRRLGRDCPARSNPRRNEFWRSRWCATLQLRGLVDRHGRPCCGFGFKLFHRKSDACELDVLVLGAASAPYMHGETQLWPPWSRALAKPYHWLATLWHGAAATGSSSSSKRSSSSSRDGGNVNLYYVLPHDVRHQNLMATDELWCKERSDEWVWCGGPPLSFFHAEYFAPGDLFPLGTARFHGLRLPVPRRPWALLNRTYGPDCAFVARLNEHGDAAADLRKPEHARLRLPAPVRRLHWWAT